MVLTLFLLSLVGGFFSGLLGVGGAVVLIPLLLAVPPLVGVGRLSMNAVSGLTMVQVLAASATGCLAHRRSGFAHARTIVTIGIPMGAFSFLGAAVSKSMTSQSMLVLFGCLVALAFVMLLRRTSGEHEEAASDFEFNGFLSVVSGSAVGLASGIIGAGGGFILIPIMIRLLKIPLRVAVGSSLGIVFIGALMGSVGKMLTLQVEWVFLVPVIGGSLPAALLGAQVSKSIPSSRVRYILLTLVLLVLVKTWCDIFQLFTAAP